MKNKISLKIISILLLLLSTLPAGVYFSISALEKIQTDTNTVNNIGYIRGSTQRLSQNIMKDEHHKIIEEIEHTFKSIDQGFISKNKDYLTISDFILHYTQLKIDWDTLKTNYSGNTSEEDMHISIRACWDNANEAAKAATDISKVKLDEITLTIYSIGSLIFILICLAIFVIHTEVRNKLEMNIILDPLTKLYNRSYLFQELKSSVKSYARTKLPFCIIFFDIDHFKEINDTFGHRVGDRVLKTFALLVNEALRDEDKAFRYGGEEFVILAKFTNAEDAYRLAERLRIKISEYDFDLDCPVTISLGISEYKEDDTIDSIITRADEAMYKAKTLGRNQSYISQA